MHHEIQDLSEFMDCSLTGRVRNVSRITQFAEVRDIFYDSAIHLPSLIRAHSKASSGLRIELRNI
jgi:hypothetical protein